MLKESILRYVQPLVQLSILQCRIDKRVPPKIKLVITEKRYKNRPNAPLTYVLFGDPLDSDGSRHFLLGSLRRV